MKSTSCTQISFKFYILAQDIECDLVIKGYLIKKQNNWKMYRQLTTFIGSSLLKGLIS